MAGVVDSSADPRVVRFEEPLRPLTALTLSESPEPSPAFENGDAREASATTPPDDAAKAEDPEKPADPVPCLYTLGRELGVGTFSVVSEVKHTETNKWYAAKIISKTLMRGREDRIRNEIDVLKRVSKDHPNILSLVDYFETSDSLYLVTEYAKGGELFDRLYTKGALQERDAAELMKQIVSGVAHLHAHGIAHRDLKPENLLFKTSSPSSSLLICDFGLSKIVDENNLRLLTTTVGTPSYMAPEIFLKRGHGRPVDVWALGVIAYFLLCGFTPFDRDTPGEERHAIETGDYEFAPDHLWLHVTRDARDFIRQCLQVDPSKRPTAQECLNSRFLTRTYRGHSDIAPGDAGAVSSFPSALEGRAMSGALSLPPAHDTRRYIGRWG